VIEVAAPVTPVSRPARLPRLRKTPVFLWKFLVGMVCCQSLLFSFLLVGWTYRFMQRVALKAWWKQSRDRQEADRRSHLSSSSRSSDPRRATHSP